MCGDGADANELGGVLCGVPALAVTSAMAETRRTTAKPIDSLARAHSEPGRDH